MQLVSHSHNILFHDAIFAVKVTTRQSADWFMECAVVGCDFSLALIVKVRSVLAGKHEIVVGATIGKQLHTEQCGLKLEKSVPKTFRRKTPSKSMKQNCFN